MTNTKQTERSRYEARIVHHEDRCRAALHRRLLVLAGHGPDECGLFLTDAEWHLETAKRHKRDAIRLQRDGGSARTP